MKLNKLIFLLIIRAVSGDVQEFEYAELQLKGPCPKINYITNLNMPQTIGWWYRAFSSVDNPLCLNNDGQTTYAAGYDQETINLEVCCRSAAIPDIAVCGRDIGTATVKAMSKPGQFTYEFDNNAYPIFALDTDYENFSIIYGCKPGPTPKQRDEIIFVFSRRYQLNETLVRRVRDVIRQNGIDWTKAKPVKQGPSIPYTPGLRPCEDDST